MNMFMEMAVQLALDNVVNNTGGPFGAVVVKDGEIVGVGQNHVTSLNDPTAHAEVQAIRDACQLLNSYQLEDCELYTSCEPCPMCLGAIFWARPKAVYFACTKEDAANIGFDDKFIYEQLEVPHENRKIPMVKVSLKNADSAFKAWTKSNDKITY
ncbi:nucleoside deaminase [Mesobacillus maritimus]|uniref:Nucleoside deaminase n=1 Tax=Mesobacillus maritimus TaxID=1643336 RepID=A0ABS7K1C4_9BACI|nr:nucleoside deaminase [Mesobacillus maritimus]MBY0096026.1 nucleoside deaminase [Mesobacillus maritimus]